MATKTLSDFLGPVDQARLKQAADALETAFERSISEPTVEDTYKILKPLIADAKKGSLVRGVEARCMNRFMAEPLVSNADLSVAYWDFCFWLEGGTQRQKEAQERESHERRKAQEPAIRRMLLRESWPTAIVSLLVGIGSLTAAAYGFPDAQTGSVQSTTLYFYLAALGSLAIVLGFVRIYSAVTVEIVPGEGRMRMCKYVRRNPWRTAFQKLLVVAVVAILTYAFLHYSE